MFRNLILRIYCWYANYTAITISELDDGYNDEPCGYCGDSQDPNDICFTCFNNPS